MNKRLLMVSIVLVVLMVGALPVLAQDTPQITPDEIPTWADFMNNSAAVFATLAIVLGPLSSVVVTILKVLLARLKPDWTKHVGLIAYFMPLALAGLYWTVDYFGFGNTFVKATNFILVIAPFVLSYVGVTVGQMLTYNGLKKLNAPANVSSSQMTAKG